MEWLKVIGISLTMIFIGFIVLRFIAKRNISEMSTFNLFLVLFLTNILSEPVRTDNFAELIIPTLVVVAVYYLYTYLSATNKIGSNLKAEPIFLVKHGNIDEKGLNKAKMTISEMLAELRVKGFTHVQDVEFAILEETGKISVIPNSAKRAITTSDLSILTGYEGIPVPLIIDGKVQYENLGQINLSIEQFFNQIEMQGYNQEMIKTISLALLDERGNIKIDQNDDINQGNIEEKQQSLIKKVQEDLKAGYKEPEDNDTGLVDDYIKPNH